MIIEVKNTNKINKVAAKPINKTMTKKQEELILMIFKTHQGEWLTPAQVRAIMCAITGTDALITSVRRGITNLTKQTKLIKSKTATAKGPYGVNNHMWTVQ